MEASILEEGKRLIRCSLDSVGRTGVVRNLRIATALLPNWWPIKTLRQYRLLCSKIDFNGSPCSIIYRGLDFSGSPQVSQSAGSQAIYLARKDNGKQSFLLQYLPPRSVTSKHFHRVTTERFHGLEGACFVEVNGEETLVNGRTFEVAPGKVHQVKTGEEPSLTLIEMLGNPDGLVMTDHYYD
ncbi:MAG: hypothetical protein KJ600_01390 [Nanoarchaeota archaeon]|nr:hypothetical protein [Nanoarchaeota archaeon]MBU1103196.1 hypothetical protein [Nanoarchaeota archaeon]